MSLVTNFPGVEEVVGILSGVDLFAADLETTGLDPRRDAIHGISLSTADQSWYLAGGAERMFMPAFKKLVQDKQVIMHNGKFDLHFLAPYGVRTPHLVDTMIAQFLINENMDLKLKSLAKSVLGLEGDFDVFGSLLTEAKSLMGAKKKSDVCIYDIPIHKLATYAEKDTRLDYDLWQEQRHSLEKEGYWDRFFNIDMPYLLVLLDMEANGVYIDQQELQTVGFEFRETLADLMLQWNEKTGGVNHNSDAELAELFFKTLGQKVTRTTKTGAASTDALALQHMVDTDQTGTAALLKKIRKIEKLVSTYILALENMPFNGRLYGWFNQTGAKTGRLSSSGPNLQNIPSSGEYGSRIRKIFSAPDGRVLVVCDYSQLEMRLAAHYTQDANLVRVFTDGLDPHQMTADLITAAGYTITRKQAKSVNFGWFYGIGPKKLQDSIESMGGERPSYKDCKGWLDGFAKGYPGAVKWKNAVLRYAAQLGYVKTIGGRKRRLPNLKSNDDFLRSQDERRAINVLPQGGGGDIINDAMLTLAPLLPSFDAKMILQVHDELVFEVPEDAVTEFEPVVKQHMEATTEHFNLRVKLIAEPGHGKNWMEAK